MTDLAVVFGGPSPEHDVSVLTGLQAQRALRSGGQARVRALYWSRDGRFYEVADGLEAEAFVGGVPRGATALRLVAGPGGGFVPAGSLRGRARRLPLSVIVNCCHGGPGEDGTLQAALDLAGADYTGPDMAGAAVGMDKLAFSALVSAHGLAGLGRDALEVSSKPGFSGPYVVKPRFGGSSIGIEVLADLETARHRLATNPHLIRGAVVEPYRPDLFDLQVAVRRWPAPELSAVERPLRSSSSPILAYADKYSGGEGMVSAPRELPARIPPALEGRVREQALEIGEICAVRGVARLDFLSDGVEELYVNEINTIPGSLAKYLWTDPPLPFTSLLRDMVAEAQARPSRAYTTEGADGSALQSAGSISSKLA